MTMPPANDSSSNPDLMTETCFLMIQCLYDNRENDPRFEQGTLGALSDEARSYAMKRKEPKKHVEYARARAMMAIAKADAIDPRELVNAAATTVLILALGLELGPKLPEVVLAALEVITDPTRGIFSMSIEDSHLIMDLAFDMMGNLR